MTAFLYPITQPIKVFTDIDGTPLNNGSIYFGVAGQNPVTSPVAMFWDSAGTIQAAQPLRTVNGYIARDGTPANIFATGDFSIAVFNSQGSLVFSNPNSVDLQLALAITGIGTAAAIPLADAGGFYTTKNVEAAFQQIGSTTVPFVTLPRLDPAVVALLMPTGAVIDFVGAANPATAPAGWVFGAGSTIGNVASNATERNNADTANLYTLLWNNYDNTRLPIQDSTGTPTTRGASAANDFAANKRLPVPDYRCKVRAGLDNMGAAGTTNGISVAGGNFDATIMGNSGGAQNHTLTTPEIPSHTHTVTDPGHLHTVSHAHTITDRSHSHTLNIGAPINTQTPGSGNNTRDLTVATSAGTTNAVFTGITATDNAVPNTSTVATGLTNNNAGGGSAHTILQPTITNTVIIKL